MKLLLSILLTLILTTSSLHSQDPHRFDTEIQAFAQADARSGTLNLDALFVGSSSIRVWTSLSDDFPDKRILNRGFGGSEMSDLFFFADELILVHRPQKIFIYEGDNDINSGKSTEAIIAQAKTIVDLIRIHLPETEIYFIAAKPSIARWHLKEAYEDFNTNLKRYCQSQADLTFVDVWEAMLDSEGQVLDDIFISDNLHMNAKGYDIWHGVFAPYMK